MTDATRHATNIALSGALFHAAGTADMFLRLHPEQAELAAAYLATVDRMREWHEGQRELVEDANGRAYNGVAVK